MGKLNAGKQMARAGMRCTLSVLSLAMMDKCCFADTTYQSLSVLT